MKKRIFTYKLFASLLLILWIGSTDVVYGQKARKRRMGILTADSLTHVQANDTIISSDSLMILDEQQKVANLEATVDTAALALKSDSAMNAMTPETKPKFIPNINRAIWMALIIPGGGQIYNRKYWKLPIIYGGFVGCAYALTWNNKMYKDYSQAYLDIMDDDDTTVSYEDFLPSGYDISSRLEYLQNLFKKRKDYYRRYRDLSIFCFIGVYILSVIDAYVDAELSDFDISKDLSLSIEPAIFNDGRGRAPNALGLQCSIKF